MAFLRFRQLIFSQKSPKTFKFGRKKIFFGITLKIKGRLWQNIYRVSIKEDEPMADGRSTGSVALCRPGAGESEIWRGEEDIHGRIHARR
jgi:hypothetical protein